MQGGDDKEPSIDDITDSDRQFSTEVMTFRSLNEIKRSLLRFPHTIEEHFSESNMMNTPKLQSSYHLKFRAVLNRIKIDFKYYQRLTITNMGTLSVKTRRELRKFNKSTSL